MFSQSQSSSSSTSKKIHMPRGVMKLGEKLSSKQRMMKHKKQNLSPNEVDGLMSTTLQIKTNTNTGGVGNKRRIKRKLKDIHPTNNNNKPTGVASSNRRLVVAPLKRRRSQCMHGLNDAIAFQDPEQKNMPEPTEQIILEPDVYDGIAKHSMVRVFGRNELEQVNANEFV